VHSNKAINLGNAAMSGTATEPDTTVRRLAGNTSAAWKLVGTTLWGIGVLLIFVVVQTVATLVVLVRARPGIGEGDLLAVLEGGSEDGVALSIATFASTLICVPVVIGIAALKRHSSIKDYFALNPVRLRSLMGWLAILALFIALSDSLTVFLGRPIVPESMSALQGSARPLWLLWLALVVAAPLFEEIFFRGFLYKGFASSVVGPAGAIVITSILWAAIHLQYDLYGICTIFVLGVLFGLARMLTGSLIVPLTLHAVSNIVAAAEAALLA
jgi:uncharacterized protein